MNIKKNVITFIIFIEIKKIHRFVILIQTESVNGIVRSV